MKTFALIGAAGYVAPRHMQAIKETGNTLVAAMDPSDSVGVLDQYFPETRFFTEFERFDRYLEKLRSEGQGIDYIVICSPNYLHDAHCRYGLRLGADVICEKPLVLNPWNAQALVDIEKDSPGTINCILQLRLHPSVIKLQEKIASSTSENDVVLRYYTPRGYWYGHSWKGDEERSGGITTNIGIHFFDMLLWVFGGCRDVTVRYHTDQSAAGELRLEKAHVQWEMSIDRIDPPHWVTDRSITNRSLLIGEEEFQFSEGFEYLHIQSYQNILLGKGYQIKDALPAIDLVHKIRKSSI